MKVYLIAGEASGDILGSLLMKRIAENYPDATFYGIGGPLMEAQGMRSLFPVQELSIMGIAEVLPKLKHILKKISETIENIRKIDPDVLITIDAQDFCARVAKGLRSGDKKCPLMIHYVAPTVWAWRPWRAKKVAGLYDGLLCLFPFELPYFQKFNMPVAYVGHPVMEQGYNGADGAAMRNDLGIPEGSVALGLFFGSRAGEVERHGEIIRDVALKLQKDSPGLHFIVPTLPHLEGSVRHWLADIHNVHLVTDNTHKPQLFTAMNAALAKSGTAALELAVANVPHVIAYKMNPLTWQIVKMAIKVRFAHLANILLNKEAVPEFIQDDCTPEKIVPVLKGLMKDGIDVENQCAEFATVRKLLHGKTKEPPSIQAAGFVLDLYSKRNDKTFVPYAKAS